MSQPIPTAGDLIINAKAASHKSPDPAALSTDMGEGSQGGLSSPSLWDHSHGGLAKAAATAFGQYWAAAVRQRCQEGR